LAWYTGNELFGYLIRCFNMSVCLLIFVGSVWLVFSYKNSNTFLLLISVLCSIIHREHHKWEPVFDAAWVRPLHVRGGGAASVREWAHVWGPAPDVWQPAHAGGVARAAGACHVRGTAAAAGHEGLQDEFHGSGAAGADPHAPHYQAPQDEGGPGCRLWEPRPSAVAPLAPNWGCHLPYRANQHRHWGPWADPSNLYIVNSCLTHVILGSQNYQQYFYFVCAWSLTRLGGFTQGYSCLNVWCVESCAWFGI